MGFRNGAYAKVWEVKDGNGNYKDARLSISRKRKDTGEYETEWSGYVRLIGEAKNKADSMTLDRIRIESCDVTNWYNKEKGTTYTNYAIFDFEDAAWESSPAPTEQKEDEGNAFVNLDTIGEDLPFV